MPPGKSAYAAAGGTTALLALVVDQLLWLEFPLAFAFGLVIGLLTPFLVAAVGVAIGRHAVGAHGRRFGWAIAVSNLLAAALGIWWAYTYDPHAFGLGDASPATLWGLLRVAVGMP